MLRRFRILLSVLILLAPATRAEESESHRQSPVLHPDDFWVQDFENRDATFSPVVEHTSTLYEVISQSVVEEKPAFGKRCAKAGRGKWWAAKLLSWCRRAFNCRP